MLVLSRQEGQQIVIAGRITVTVLTVRGNQIRLGIEAPREMSIRRTELGDAPPPRAVSAA